MIALRQPANWIQLGKFCAVVAVMALAGCSKKEAPAPKLNISGRIELAKGLEHARHVLGLRLAQPKSVHHDCFVVLELT